MTARDPAKEPDDSGQPPEEALAVAGVVHDVNQMLAVITGRAGLLLKRAEDAELARHLQAILLASGDAATMLKRLSGGQTAGVAAQGRTLLREVAEQARLLVWPADDQAWPWQNDIGEQLSTSVPPQVLREVLANLLLNALEVMPDGGRMTLSAEEGPDGRVLLRVSDSGPGLPNGDPEQIFGLGFSASGKKGRGVGLAGCRQLLQGAQGMLTAEVRPAGGPSGAILILDLPVGESTVAASGGAPAAVPAMAVLVVDDEVVVREMLSDVMAEWGCGVQAYRDGATTLAQYTPGSAAVAVIDVNLPGISGLELATRLRDSDPCLSIVMVTGWRQDDILAKTDPLVVDQKAHKPLELANIRDILIQGHQLNQARCAEATPE